MVIFLVRGGGGGGYFLKVLWLQYQQIPSSFGERVKGRGASTAGLEFQIYFLEVKVCRTGFLLAAGFSFAFSLSSWWRNSTERKHRNYFDGLPQHAIFCELDYTSKIAKKELLHLLFRQSTSFCLCPCALIPFSCEMVNFEPCSSTVLGRWLQRHSSKSKWFLSKCNYFVTGDYHSNVVNFHC